MLIPVKTLWIPLFLTQVDKIFRNVIDNNQPIEFANANIEQLKSKYRKANLIHGSNYCVAKCFVIYLTYIRDIFAQIFQIDINQLTYKK